MAVRPDAALFSYSAGENSLAGLAACRTFWF